MPESGTGWSPRYGATLRQFATRQSYLDESGRDQLVSSTLRILGRCLPPDANGTQSCLVVGEVQSGKTASFTALIAAARDNGFALAVVMAGTKKILHEQTADRLTEDLQVDGDGGAQRWVALTSPKRKQWSMALDCVTRWNDPLVPPEYKPVLILTCLKNEAGIGAVRDLVAFLQESVGENLPVIVVDDEADQAGLNLRHSSGDMSATYAAIDSLRQELPSHSYVLYTATPQALTLLSLTDALSPRWVVVLQSGPDYIGGRELFTDTGSRFFQIIPDSEIQTATSPAPGEGPPPSLKRSLAAFVVAIVVAQRRPEGPHPISMLIHPSSSRNVHQVYERWVRGILDNWKHASEEPEQWADVMRTSIAPAIESLEGQVDVRSALELDPLSSSDAVAVTFATLLPFWLRQLEGSRIRVVNSDKGLRDLRSRDWATAPAWILIGGNKLERGFTIENLAITYMPRGPGVGLIDTIQQRGRFFGYKRSYKGLLRGWLNADVRDAFRDIVESEQQLRGQLRRVDAEETSLAEWRRSLVMEPSLQATRAAVISMATSRTEVRAGWRFKQHRLFHPSLAALGETVESQMQRLKATAQPHPMDQREDREHLLAPLSADLLAELLFDWPMHAEDRAALDPLLVLLRHYARIEGHLDTHVIFMDGLIPRKRRRDPGALAEQEKNWRIQNLHAGRSAHYPGDAQFRTSDAVTVQIHRVTPTNPSNNREYPAVLALALAWPTGFDRALVQQR